MRDALLVCKVRLSFTIKGPMTLKLYPLAKSIIKASPDSTCSIEYQDITGADVERSQFFLESSNWNLEMALGSFFENEAGGGPAQVEMGDETGAGAAASADPPASAAEPPKPSPARPAGRGNIFLESDDEDSDSDMVNLIQLSKTISELEYNEIF